MLVFAVRFAQKSYIGNMRAKRAENFDLLTFAPPPLPIRKNGSTPCLYSSLY